MSKLKHIKNAIDTLREMERQNMPTELLNNLDRYIREQIFGRYKIELTADEIVALQDYYIQTL